MGPKHKRLFVHYDTREEHQQPEVGDRVCQWPPHITIMIIDTLEEDAVLQTIDELVATSDPIHIGRGELGMIGIRHKPAYYVDDYAGELANFHLKLFHAIGKLAYSHVVQAYYAGHAYEPHVTVHRITAEPYHLPQHITIDRITVTENFNTNHRCNRGVVRYIGRIATADYESNLADEPNPESSSE